MFKNILKDTEYKYADIDNELRGKFNTQITLTAIAAIVSIIFGIVYHSISITMIAIILVLVSFLLILNRILNTLDGKVGFITGEVVDVYDKRATKKFWKKEFWKGCLDKLLEKPSYVKLKTKNGQFVTIYLSNILKASKGDILGVYLLISNCYEKAENSYVVHSPYHVYLINENES